VSHSNIKTKRVQRPNLKRKRYFIPSENRWVELRVTTSAMRTIDRIGIERAVAEMRARGETV
jgi:large subunit ribosomal protein L28